MFLSCDIRFQGKEATRGPSCFLCLLAVCFPFSAFVLSSSLTELCKGMPYSCCTKKNLVDVKLVLSYSRSCSGLMVPCFSKMFLLGGR